MNGIIQRLGEMADISINVDDVICAEITNGSNAIQCPNWYEQYHTTAKGILIGVDNAHYYSSPCITVVDFTCSIITYFKKYSFNTVSTYPTDTTNTSDIYKIVFNTTNIAASCYLYKNDKQDSSREYLAIFLKS